jgi:hypothetical protein
MKGTRMKNFLIFLNNKDTENIFINLNNKNILDPQGKSNSNKSVSGKDFFNCSYYGVPFKDDFFVEEELDLSWKN